MESRRTAYLGWWVAFLGFAGATLVAHIVLDTLLHNGTLSPHSLLGSIAAARLEDAILVLVGIAFLVRVAWDWLHTRRAR